MVIQEEGGIEYVYTTDLEKGGGFRQMLTWLTKGGWGVGEMLKLADKREKGESKAPHFRLTYFVNSS